MSPSNEVNSSHNKVKNNEVSEEQNHDKVRTGHNEVREAQSDDENIEEQFLWTVARFGFTFHLFRNSIRKINL